ncbi:MAG: hypothetical protein IKX77_01875 [Clostridia bacterium]|nr:hypothetical protein [Clostridia bacterium]
MKKIRFILLTCLILFVLTVSAFATARITYSIVKVNNDGLYKIAAVAENAGGKYTAFKSDVTFNLSIFRPANKNTGALIDVAANVNTKAPIKVTNYYDDVDDETVTASMPQNPFWNVNGNTCELTVEQGMIGGHEVGTGLMMMEMYFKFAEGKSASDVTASDFIVDYVKYSDLVTGEETYRLATGTNTLDVKNDTYETTLSMSDASCLQGETFDIVFTLTNNPGINNLSFALTYDSLMFTLESISGGTLFSGSEIASPVEPFEFSSSSNKTGDGTVAVFTFSVRDDCPAVSYDFELFYVSASGTLDESYEIVPQGCTVEVSANPALAFASTRASARSTTYKKRAAIRFMAKSSQYNEFDDFGFLLSRVDTLENNGFTELTHDAKVGGTNLYIEAFCVDDSHNRIYSEDTDGARTFSMLASNIPADKTDVVFIARPFATFGTKTVYGVAKSGSYDSLSTT